MMPRTVSSGKRLQRIRHRLYEIIEKAEKGDRASTVFDSLIISLIILNVAAIIIGSFDTAGASLRLYLRAFEVVSVAVFTVEYVLRLCTSDYSMKGGNLLVSVLKYMASPMALIDLLAILPFYLPFLLPFDLRFLRVLRLTRLLRIFKLNRYSTSMRIIGKIIKERKEELLVTIFVTFLLLLIASSLMYYIEHDVQPETFPNILSSFWWAIATLTTIGYGDVYPHTDLGRLLSGIIAILGIGLVALPTGIISSGFISAIQERKRRSEESPKYCPYCGKRIRE